MELLKTISVRSTFLLHACRKWFPPIAPASPSPLTTMTLSSGLASFTPVANASARPWVVWSVLQSMYPGSRDAHPIPDTMAVLSLSSFSASIALMMDFIINPCPQPGHHMCGSVFFLR
jgi:hypothetical protein